MSSYVRPVTVLISILAVLLLFAVHTTHTQTHPGLITVSLNAESSPSEFEDLETLLERKSAEGTLVLRFRHGDNQIPGRQHEGFTQKHVGIPVYGASISKQIESGRTISIFGALYTNIEVDPNPKLSSADVQTLLEDTQDQTFGPTQEELIILPTLMGSYRLSYKTTSTDAITYFVDANTGDLLLKLDERHQQSAVGSGEGAQGTLKKLSVSQTSDEFEARDLLRPSEILTLTTKGGGSALSRMIYGDLMPTDTARDTDNVWTDSAVVDAHVHMGWSYDYFSQQHAWNGLNGQGASLYGATAGQNVLPSNAFFIGPPFGPDGLGMVVFGTSFAGNPMSTLDIVAHELMHGVTEFGVRRRSPYGLSSFIELDGYGPTGMNINGQWTPCASVSINFGGGNIYPAYCVDGKFALASNAGGATHEALSDIFGTAVEFAFHDPGDGLLKADYDLGEDIPEFGTAIQGTPGPLRTLKNPRDLFVDSTRTIRYPDHYDRRLRFMVVECGNGCLALTNVAYDGEQMASLVSSDSAGVHWNASVFGHVFYLAVEGGTNVTSSLMVNGVGADKRTNVENVFFRAVTEIMPGYVSMPIVAAVIRQAAIDLYPNSDTHLSIESALQAAGF